MSRKSKILAPFCVWASLAVIAALAREQLDVTIEPGVSPAIESRRASARILVHGTDFRTNRR